MSNLWKDFEGRISKFCPHVPPGGFDYSVNISLKYQYLYVENPKAGCSTIKSILQKMELEDTEFYRQDFDDIHNRHFSPLLKPSQIANFEKFIDGPVFKFCFVRNPFSRLLSVYLDKICGNKPQKRQVLMHLGRNVADIEQNVSFDEFVNVVCEQPITNMDPHWRIQYYQTFQQSIKYDFIGKLENSHVDLPFALEKINKNYRIYMQEEKRHAQNAGKHIGEYYSPDLVKKVQDKFARDFDFFAYDPEI